MPQKPQTHFQSLLVLLLVYVLAAWAPGLGNWLREWRINPFNLCPGIQVQHGMLALMLICAALSGCAEGLGFNWGQSLKVLLITGLSWLLPALAGIVAVILLGFVKVIPVEIRLAVLIVSAMPVANSTAGWANKLGANMSLSLAVLMAATMLSPVITAPLINLGTYASGLQQVGVDALPAWGNDMSTFFALWVLIPIVLGVLLSQLAPKRFVLAAKPWAGRLSWLILLGLNYVNGTVCLPGLTAQPGEFARPLFAASVLVALIIAMYSLLKHSLPALHTEFVSENSVSVNGSANNFCNPRQFQDSDKLSLLLAVVMRNTGAAMVYTSTALASVPLVSLVVVFYTLMQHLLIGVIISWPRYAVRANTIKVGAEFAER